MKQFDLQEYLKNPDRRIITRNGRSVRIICKNRLADDYPIVALVMDEDSENSEDLLCYTRTGELFKNLVDGRDLFFAPEKKEGWINIYRTPDGVAHPSEIYTSKEEAEASAKNCVYYITTIKIEWDE